MLQERFANLIHQLHEEINKTTSAKELEYLMEALYDLGDHADDKMMLLERDLDDLDDLEDDD